MVADYTANRDSLAAGKPKLWSPKILEFRGVGYPYELAPDGKRFAVILNAAGMDQEQRSNDSVTVVLNFFDELRRLVPAGGK